MKALLKERWQLILLLLIFIVFKIPHLSCPFYWDESWSYAPGVRLMYEHGPSLMPNAINSEYSRGHPLLFYAASATWMRLFGDSHFSIHAFGLFISVLLLISLYEVGLKLFSRNVAVLATLIMGLQVMFFVQASYILPEVMVALLSFLSLYFFVREKHWLTFIFLSALLLTKESGVAMGAVLGIFSFIALFRRQMKMTGRVKPLLSVAMAGVVIISFFLLQKYLLGWFFYPLHTELIKWEWNTFYEKFMVSFDVLFVWNKRLWLFVLLLAVSTLAILKRKWSGPLLLPIALIIYGVVHNKWKWLSDENHCLIFMITLAIYLVMLARDKGLNAIQKRFIIIGCVFLISYLAFAGINFFTPRYLVTPLTIIIFITAALLQHYAGAISKYLYYPVLAIVIYVGVQGFTTDNGIGDTQLRSYNAMKVQQAVVNYLEDHNYYDRSIGTGPYQDVMHLTEPAAGFLRSSKQFKEVRWSMFSGDTDIAIFSSIEPDARYDEVVKSGKFKRVYRVVNGEIWAEVYLNVKMKP